MFKWLLYGIGVYVLYRVVSGSGCPSADELVKMRETLIYAKQSIHGGLQSVVVGCTNGPIVASGSFADGTAYSSQWPSSSAFYSEFIVQ